MSSLWGMSSEQVREHAADVQRAVAMLGTRWDELADVVRRRETFWRGPDADRFSEEWTRVGDLHGAALERLRWSGEELGRHAEEQDQASAAGGDGAGGSTQPADPVAGAGRAAFLPSLLGVAFNPGDGVPSGDDPAIQEAWQEMSEEDRKAVLREVVADELEAYGIEAEGLLAEVEVRFFPAWMNRGAISLETGIIYLSDALLESPYGLQIAAHEARHQVQYEMIRRTDADPWDWITGDDNSEEYAQVEEEYGFTREEIEQWRHEFEPWNYEFPPIGDPADPAYEEQMQRYENQEVEVNAREREREFADEFTVEDLQEAQRDAGVPVSDS